jgi:hypothetical protein
MAGSSMSCPSKPPKPILEPSTGAPRLSVVGAREDSGTDARNCDVISEVTENKVPKPVGFGYRGFQAPLRAGDGDKPKPQAQDSKMRAALQEIARVECRAGMIVWLECAHPNLYRALLIDIPDAIDRSYGADGRPHEFDAALARLVDVYRQAAQLYNDLAT